MSDKEILNNSKINVYCQYCNQKANLVDSSVIYGKSYGLIYLCKPCDAYVGVHKGTTKPLGILANAELREWKKKAHSIFDPIWKNGKYTRKEAYRILADKLGEKEVHIGESDIDKCKKIIEICNQL